MENQTLFLDGKNIFKILVPKLIHKFKVSSTKFTKVLINHFKK